jgi:hypothetical protein
MSEKISDEQLFAELAVLSNFDNSFSNNQNSLGISFVSADEDNKAAEFSSMLDELWDVYCILDCETEQDLKSARELSTKLIEFYGHHKTDVWDLFDWDYEDSIDLLDHILSELEYYRDLDASEQDNSKDEPEDDFDEDFLDLEAKLIEHESKSDLEKELQAEKVTAKPITLQKDVQQAILLGII